MSFADIFGNYDFSDYSDSYNDILPESSFQDFTAYDDILPESSFYSFDAMPADDPFDQDEIAHFVEEFGADAKGNFELLQGGEYDPGDDEPGGFYGEIDNRSLNKQAQDFLFKTLGVDAETAKAISAFAKAAQKGGGKQGQAQGRGRVGPGLPTSARAPTSEAGRTSKAGRTLSGQQSIERTIEQSRRATSAARAIANQMARAGTITSTNDLADMISGSDKPMGTRQKLPGTNLRQLAIPRTQMA